MTTNSEIHLTFRINEFKLLHCNRETIANTILSYKCDMGYNNNNSNSTECDLDNVYNCLTNRWFSEAKAHFQMYKKFSNPNLKVIPPYQMPINSNNIGSKALQDSQRSFSEIGWKSLTFNGTISIITQDLLLQNKHDFINMDDNSVKITPWVVAAKDCNIHVNPIQYFATNYATYIDKNKNRYIFDLIVVGPIRSVSILVNFNFVSIIPLYTMSCTQAFLACADLNNNNNCDNIIINNQYNSINLGIEPDSIEWNDLDMQMLGYIDIQQRLNFYDSNGDENYDHKYNYSYQDTDTSNDLDAGGTFIELLTKRWRALILLLDIFSVVKFAPVPKKHHQISTQSMQLLYHVVKHFMLYICPLFGVDNQKFGPFELLGSVEVHLTDWMMQFLIQCCSSNAYTGTFGTKMIDIYRQFCEKLVNLYPFGNVDQCLRSALVMNITIMNSRFGNVENINCRDQQYQQYQLQLQPYESIDTNTRPHFTDMANYFDKLFILLIKNDDYANYNKTCNNNVNQALTSILSMLVMILCFCHNLSYRGLTKIRLLLDQISHNYIDFQGESLELHNHSDKYSIDRYIQFLHHFALLMFRLKSLRMSDYYGEKDRTIRKEKILSLLRDIQTAYNVCHCGARNRCIYESWPQIRDWCVWVEFLSGKSTLGSIAGVGASAKVFNIINYYCFQRNICKYCQHDTNFDDLSNITQSKHLFRRLKIVFNNCSVFSKQKPIQYDLGMENFAQRLGFGKILNINHERLKSEDDHFYSTMLCLCKNIASKRHCSICKCSTKTLKRCKNCNNRFYCSKKCQKKDWNNNEQHQSLCVSM